MRHGKENNGMKKLFVFSNQRAKDFIEDFLSKESEDRGTTQSAIIEEVILKGIVLGHPELLEEARNVYKQNLDPLLIGDCSLDNSNNICGKQNLIQRVDEYGCNKEMTKKEVSINGNHLCAIRE